MRRKVFIGAAAVLFLAAFTLSAHQMQKMAMKPLPPKVEQQLMGVRKDLNSVKTELPEMGCCNDPACNFCPLVAGKCPCGMNVKTDVGVCGECKQGWAAGDGRVAGVNPSQVKDLNREMLMMMYQARAMSFPKGQKQMPAGHDHNH